MTREDVPQVNAFLLARTSPGRAQHRPGWLEWQYVQNPDGFDVRLVEADRMLVGLSGFLPCRLSIEGDIKTGAFSTSTLVDERYRRRGIGRTLHELRLRDYDVALSSGQSAENLALYRKLGFVECGRYRRLLVQTRRPALRLEPRVLRERLSWLRWIRTSDTEAADLRVAVSRAVPELDGLSLRERFDRREVGPSWNRDHLVWRYERHPYFTYRFVQVFSGERSLGVAVVREDESSTVLADVYCRLTDATALLQAVARHVRSPIVGQFVGPRLAARFRRAGWTSFASRNRLLFKANDPVLHRALVARTWSFFGGDSDADC